MKFYFFTFNKEKNFKSVGTFNDVSLTHPIYKVISWNKDLSDVNQEIFYTLVFFAEISKERYDMYKANEKYI